MKEPPVTAEDAAVTATYKVGKNKGRPRIWIDGKKLAEAGFTGGTVYYCHVRAGEITCALGSIRPLPVDSEYLRVHARKVTGRPGGKPIIDMLGTDVEDAFPGAERVRATFRRGRIVIERES